MNEIDDNSILYFVQTYFKNFINKIKETDKVFF